MVNEPSVFGLSRFDCLIKKRCGFIPRRFIFAVPLSLCVGGYIWAFFHFSFIIFSSFCAPGRLCSWLRHFVGLFTYIITKTRICKYIENFTTKRWKFSDKKNDIFHISAQNIDCGYSLEPPRRGGSNEYPQSMFLSRNKKNNVYPCKPQFYYIKVGFKGVKII